MAALGDLLEQLDTDPVRRGSQFERICQWFLTNVPVYAHELATRVVVDGLAAALGS